jgi:ABC-type glycerol-3-phosphate transport system permease component
MAGRRRAIRHILVYAGLASFLLAVVFPLVRMVIAAIFAFTLSMHDYLYAVVLSSSSGARSWRAPCSWACPPPSSSTWSSTGSSAA